jgi:hypothetical protein
MRFLRCQGGDVFVGIVKEVLILHGIGLVWYWLQSALLSQGPVDIREELVLFHVLYGDAEVRLKDEDLL